MTIFKQSDALLAHARQIAKAFKASQAKTEYLRNSLLKLCEDYKTSLELDYSAGDDVVLKGSDAVKQVKDFEVKWSNKTNDFEVIAVVKVKGIKNHFKYPAVELEKHLPGRIRL